MISDDFSIRLQYFKNNKDITEVHDNVSIKSHNHMPFNYVLGNKKAMFYNMK